MSSTKFLLQNVIYLGSRVVAAPAYRVDVATEMENRPHCPFGPLFHFQRNIHPIHCTSQWKCQENETCNKTLVTMLMDRAALKCHLASFPFICNSCASEAPSSSSSAKYCGSNSEGHESERGDRQGIEVRGRNLCIP